MFVCENTPEKEKYFKYCGKNKNKIQIRLFFIIKHLIDVSLFSFQLMKMNALEEGLQTCLAGVLSAVCELTFDRWIVCPWFFSSLTNWWVYLANQTIEQQLWLQIKQKPASLYNPPPRLKKKKMEPNVVVLPRAVFSAAVFCVLLDEKRNNSVTEGSAEGKLG